MIRENRKYTPEQRAAFVADFDALTPQLRLPWLKEHRFNWRTISKWREEMLYGTAKKAPKKSASKRPAPQPVPKPAPTLEEAINALEIRMDVMQEVLGMLRGLLK